jgi:hypothetical protein
MSAPNDSKKPVKQSNELVNDAQASVASNSVSKGPPQVSVASTTCNTLPQSAAAPSSSKGQPPASGTATPKLVVNHLLTYASFYRNRSTENNLLKVVTGFYSAGKINEGKNAC